MIKVRPADSIYHKSGGWFDARWHFSFDDYYDADYVQFGNMRVFNDDRLIPGAIWPMHPHRNIEGLTYVAEGTFRHQDNVGGGGVLPAGSVQRMTLGSGAYHSEQNGSETEPMRFIQVWIMPEERDLPPGVEQKVFTKEDRTNRLLHTIGPNRDDGAILVNGHASMYISRLEEGASVNHEFAPNKAGYLYHLGGHPITLNGEGIRTGEAAMITDEPRITLTAANGEAELVMMEVATE